MYVCTNEDGMTTTFDKREDGFEKSFQVDVRVDTPQEADYYRNGGILPFVLRQLARA